MRFSRGFLFYTMSAFFALSVARTAHSKGEEAEGTQDAGATGDTDAASHGQDVATASSPPKEPGPPPPGTLGTPTEGSVVAPLTPVRALADSPNDSQSQTGRLESHYTIEGIELRGNTFTLGSVILKSIPFRAGDVLDVADRELELSRFRLLSTGFFRSVQYSLRRGSSRGYVVLIIEVVERNTIVFNGIWLGLSANAEPNGQAKPLTPYAGFDVSEVNLVGTGATLGGAFAFADNQFAVQSRFYYPQFLKSGWGAEVSVRYSDGQEFFGNKDVEIYQPNTASTAAQDYAALPYRRFGGDVGTSHDLGISTRLALNYRIERIVANVPLAASAYRGADRVPIDFSIIDGASILSTASARIDFDTRDEPFLPTRGDNFVGQVDISLSPLGSDYPYVRLQGRAQHWLSFPWGHTLKLSAFAGAIAGNAPFFEKFYVGDMSDLLPDRVLGLNFDRRPAPNFFNTAIVEIRYGSFATKLDAEYGLPLYRGGRSVYGIDVFGSVGLYALANTEDLTNPAAAYTAGRTLPIDLNFNLGLRIDTQAGCFAFGLSNLLGLLPVHGANQGMQR